MTTQDQHICGVTYLLLASVAALRSPIGQRSFAGPFCPVFKVRNQVNAHLQRRLGLYNSLEPIWVQNSRSLNRTNTTKKQKTQTHCSCGVFVACISHYSQG